MVTEPDQLSNNCGACRPERCFNHSARIVTSIKKMPTLVIDRSNWWQVVDACRKTFNNPAWDELAAVNFYGICARSIVSPLSFQLLHLWRVTGGIQARTPAEYAHLSARWTDAVMIINDTIAKAKAARNVN